MIQRIEVAQTVSEPIFSSESCNQVDVNVNESYTPFLKHLPTPLMYVMIQSKVLCSNR